MGTFILGILVFNLSLSGQSISTQSLGGEIQRIEKLLDDPKTSGTSRYGALVRLAELLMLSGNIEAAAETWNKAAIQGIGGRLDGNSMLAATLCFIAIGELDKADMAVKMVLLTSTEPRIIREGKYLGCLTEAIRSGNEVPLSALLEDREFGDRRPAVLYILWKLTGRETYQSRLKNEFPQSPEARIVRDAAGPVSGSPGALWLLFPGRESITLAEPQKLEPPSPAGSGAPGPASGTNMGSMDGKADSALTGTASTVLQTGLFSREENALIMVERLRKAGFSPFITQRRVRDTYFYAVNISPGDDMNTTIIRLKEAGVEAFPVFLTEGPE